MRRKATSSDVAARAGVSRAAVSMVLNGRAEGNVSTANQEAIRAAAAELGYVPNSVARSLRSSRTHTVGVVTDAIVTTAFGGRLLSGAMDAADAAGYLTLVLDTRRDEARTARSFDLLRERQVDGLMFAAMELRPFSPPPVMLELPSVVAQAWDPQESVTSVWCDEVGGGRAAARALLDAGHRDVAMLAGTDDVVATQRRVQGFHEALADAGLPRVEPVTAGWEIKAGYDAGLALLDRADRPTGVVCANDRVAAGVVLAASTLGLAVPQDLSVVGYDDDENVAPVMAPPLTTVGLPHRQMGEEAMRRLLADLTGEPAPPQHVVLDCPLVERGSVTAPRAATR